MRRLLHAERSAEQETYRQRLGAIGMVLDARGSHSMVITDVDGGMLVRASRKGSRHPEIIEFVDGEQIPAERLDPRVEVRRRLFPGGYAPFLEALGDRLDQRKALAISIVEGTDFVTVSGFAPLPVAGEESIYEALDLLLLPEDIARLVERGVTPEPQPVTPEPATVAQRAPARGAGTDSPLGAALASFARVMGLARPQSSRLRG